MTSFDSPVVKEIPIFLSQSLSRKLLVFQYPLEDPDRPDNATILECSMKDDNEVMIDLERDIDSRNFCRSLGEKYAANADGNKEDDVAFPKKIMDKQTLISKVLRDKNIAVGIYEEGELHLTQAAGYVLLRPSYKHIDMGEKRAKQEAKEKGEGDLTEDDEEELQQITVKFERQESERAKKAREKSFTYLSKQTTQQSWRKMNYHEPSSVRAELDMRKLFCGQPSERVEDHTPSGVAKLDTLVPDVDSIYKRSSHGYPLTKLPGTLLDRIKGILTSARVIDMAALNRILGEPATPSEVQDRIKVVQHVAALVQGCWVIQSDVIIPKDTTPNGVPTQLARCARDYMLYQFTKTRKITRSQLLEVIKIPGDLVKIMLEEIARRNGKEWEFKLPTDVQFTTQHREVEQRQQAKWELRLEQILAGLRPSEAGATQSNRHRRRSGRESFSSDNEASERRNYPGKMRRTHKNSESKQTDSSVS